MDIKALIADEFGTQTALAIRLGVSQASVCEWCKGRRPIPPLRALQIESLSAGRIKATDLNPKAVIQVAA